MGEYGGGEIVAAYFEDDRKIKNVGEPSSSQKDNNALQHDQHVPSSSQKDRTPFNCEESSDHSRRLRNYGRAPMIEDLFAGSARSQPSEDAYGGGHGASAPQLSLPVHLPEQTSTRRLNPSVTVHPPERKSTHHVNPTVETTEKEMSFVPDVGSHDSNEGPRKCYCGIPVALATSWTEDNPSRRFEACKFYNPNTNFGGCKFFRWFDRPQCDWQRDVINKLLKERKLLNYELKWIKEERKKMLEEMHNLIVDRPVDVVMPVKQPSKCSTMACLLLFFGISCVIAIGFKFM